ncbi:Glycosyltransferase involved in cell wall bisynthesis [Propionibacterium cyclohexanicum]|uniref:Glycosyltransferase involved in cell wall bisynthesis n=1 Tax=Propionibacterium cyclohexanicum TaxID=64702 RepID=A0A1H9SGV9_9ACTN|nr:glycosyltransferase [Propionibacterium cyclohexanicum]SER84280.1 Glycosyltransferase involved in cell wall bisynthesis [Propionibacterium cyclohexanicum]
MRIAMVSEHASPLAVIGGVDAGGQNVHVAELSAALGRRGHHVVVYTRRDDPTLPDRVVFAPGVEVVHVAAGPALPLPKDLLYPHMDALARGLASQWRAEPPDVVHGHFWMSGVAALQAVRLAQTPDRRPPVVQTFHALGTVKRRHQGPADTSPPERAMLEPRLAREVDRIIATCPDEVRELRAMGARPRRISVAPCGVDLGHFRAEGPSEPTGGRRRIAVVGRLVARKGIDLVIAALHELAAEGIGDVDLHIIGGSSVAAGLEADPEAGRLAREAVELGVADQVIFRGQLPREEMPQVLRSCAAVVCAPWYEPFGIVPLEAMACGIPVVVSAVGGLQDSVVDGVTGLHVRPRDHRALAAAIRRILDDPSLATRMGRAGRHRVEKHYSWNTVAELTEQAYLSCVAQLGARRANAPLTALLAVEP